MELSDILYRNGANPNIKDRFGYTVADTIKKAGFGVETYIDVRVGEVFSLSVGKMRNISDGGELTSILSPCMGAHAETFIMKDREGRGLESLDKSQEAFEKFKKEYGAEHNPDLKLNQVKPLTLEDMSPLKKGGGLKLRVSGDGRN